MRRCILIFPGVLALVCWGCAGGSTGDWEMLRRCTDRTEQRNLSDLRGRSARIERRSSASRTPVVSWTLTDMPGSNYGSSPEDGAAWSASQERPERLGPGRGPLPGFLDTVRRDLKRWPRSLWDDTKAVYTDPGNLAILGVAGASSLAVRVTGVDGKIDDSHKRRDTFQDEWSDAVGVLGNPATHFAMAGLWYLVGQQTQDEKTYEVGRTLINALAINGVSTMLLKVAANTEAPNGEGPAWPSGHSSSSFTVAEVLNVSYGPWVGVPSYALAALAAFGRIDDREHDFSDVLFGAALGIVVGHSVAEGHRPEIFGGQITAYVSPGSGASGIAWVTSF
jgi:membrane-associated phospholipid phosphatase